MFCCEFDCFGVVLVWVVDFVFGSCHGFCRFGLMGWAWVLVFGLGFDCFVGF